MNDLENINNQEGTVEFSKKLASEEFFSERITPPHFKHFLKFFSAKVMQPLTAAQLCSVYDAAIREYFDANWQAIYCQDMKMAGIESEEQKVAALADGFLLDEKKERFLAEQAWRQYLPEVAEEFFSKEFCAQVSKIMEINKINEEPEVFIFKA